MRGLRKITAMVFVAAMLLSISLPVLGEYGEEATNPEEFVNNQAETYAKAFYYEIQTQPQLNVTVPLNLIFAVTDSGTMVFPQDYGIVNKSAVDVKVTNISIELNDGDYALVNSVNPGEKQIALKMKGIKIDDGTPVYEDVISIVSAGEQSFGKTTPGVWTITAASDDNGNELRILFEGKMKGAQSTWTKADPHKLFTITYTIAEAA